VAALFLGGVKKILKMAAVAMVTKVQKMLNSNRTADPFET
jgi:predicted metal-binding membrane protein